jgi:2-(1,2-epoxy-1,2-dihydrophenyl)acetyl-CoA isomerase
MAAPAAAAQAEHVRYEVDRDLARIELCRPEVLNALNAAMGWELSAAVGRAAADPGVRAVLVCGAGRAFCAGADLREPRETLPDGTPDLASRLRAIYNPLFASMRRLPKPLVCAVQGAAAGIGASLALACDLIVAAESSYFLLAFARVGLIPDGGALAALAARIGPARALRLALLGDRLPATVARDWGVLDDVVPDRELATASERLARRLAEGPTTAYASVKELIYDGFTRTLCEQLELEASLQQRQAQTEDYAEGLAAFLEKRAPRFSGR